MFTATHLHLMLNHLPLFGGAIDVVLLGWALLARSKDLTRAAFILAIVCGVAAIVARQTGHGAEHQVAQLPWADRKMIHEHEEAGDKTFAILTLGALIAALGFGRTFRGKDGRIEAMVTLAVVLFGTMCAGWAALEGGKIRHEEVRPGFVFPQGGDTGGEEHEH